MSGRPRKACDHCNSQKVRCSGHRPSCERCLRGRRPCVYGKSAPVQAACASGATPYQQLDLALSAPQAGITEKSYMGIPRALIATLVEVYFSHIYNASLLLHKPTFLQALAAGTVRPQVLLSVCAFATKFYRDAAENTTLADSGFGQQWAERGTRLVLQEADEPDEENIPAFINLALFWYSEGKWRKCNMLKCIGTQTAHLLGLIHQPPGTQDSFTAELRRRRFWACYLMEAHGADTTSAARTPPDNFSNRALPCLDEDYERGCPQDATCLSGFRSNGSLYAELANALTLWTEVYRLIKKPEPRLASRLAALQELDSRINDCWASMSSSLTLTPASVATVPLSLLPRLLLVHIVYHQCLCALHASIVPLYSWSAGDESCWYARQVSAQVAWDHANAASALFDAALRRPWDTSRIPSFVGYAAYCACAIQMPFVWCSNPVVRGRAYANVLIDLRMIHLLGKYWKLVAYLGVNVRSLHEMHARNPYPVDDEPKRMDARTLNGFKASAARARETILGHTNILWARDGGIAHGEDLPNLRPDDVDPGLSDAVHGASCVVSYRSLLADKAVAPPIVSTPLVMEEERQRDGSDVAATQRCDSYQSYLDPGLFQYEAPVSPDDILDGWHMNSFEEWVDGFQFSAEPAMPGHG